MSMTPEKSERSSESRPAPMFNQLSSELPLPDTVNRSCNYEMSLFESSREFSLFRDDAHAPQDANEMMQKFYVFLNEFEDAEPRFEQPKGPEPTTYKPYMLQLRRMSLSAEENLYLNAAHLYERQEYLPLYKLLIWEPQYSLHLFDGAAKQLFHEEHGETRRVRVVPFNLASTKQLRDIGNQSVLSLMQMEGIIIRMSQVAPTLMVALFQCQYCHHTEKVRLFAEKIVEPHSCPKCNAKFSMEIQHENCTFMDRQTVKLQEMPESVPQGETPLSVLMVVHDDMVDQVRPGDRVRVVGVLRAEARREALSRRTVKMLYDNFLDVVSYSRMNSRKQLKFGAPGADLGYLDKDTLVRPGEADDDYLAKKLVFSAEEEEAILALGKTPDLYTRLADAIAPSIFECQDVKKGLLMQLFGAKEKRFSQSGRGRFRSEINLLLIGDPSTAKSQLLQYVNKISPRGIYTSGKGSSAVGLTAYVKRDPESGQPVLESGALVLSDRGICCIDEFDKMSDNARSVLHEVMEQQTVSIAKAGVVCQLNARAAVLAAANPVNSRYNPNLSVVKNLNLPPSLLSRFDLIYLMLDAYSPAMDRQLAQHILSMYCKDPVELTTLSPVEPALLCAYISYARDRVKPQLTDEACSIIKRFYTRMRRVGVTGKVISATTRQIESMIRLSEAHARMRLSPLVEEQDAYEAVRLIEVATQRAATSPDGRIDMGRIQTGFDESTRRQVEHIKESLLAVVREHPIEFKMGVRFQQLKEWLHATEARRLVEEAEDIDILYVLYSLESDERVVLLGNRQRPTVRVQQRE